MRSSENLRLAQGQSLLEYVILMVILIVAIAGLRSYLLYAFQGRLNESRMTMLGQTPAFDAKRGADATWEYFYEISPAKPELTVVSPDTIKLAYVDGTIATRRGVRTKTSSFFREESRVTQNGR